MNSAQKITVEIKGSDFVEAQFLNGKWSFQVIGCRKLEEVVAGSCDPNLSPEKWTLPPGDDHASMLVRELILKAQKKWQFPISTSEICHCRSVSTETVDEAVLMGARSIDLISKRTSAGTSCGTCSEDLEKVLCYRLKTY